MSRSIPAEFLLLKAGVAESMLSYMEEQIAQSFDPGYTVADVEKCGAILEGYLFSVLDPVIRGDAVKIRKLVKSAVLSLNALNRDCAGALIETDQREQICDLIIGTYSRAGLETDEDDVTFEWREW